MTVAIIGRGAIGSWLAERLEPAPIVVARGDPLPAARVVVEAAGHEALQEYGTAALEQGSDLIVASVGALADEELFGRLKTSARTGRLLIPAGAVAGVDGLAAARRGGLDRVHYTSRKPPASLPGVIDPTIESVIFEGNAREAAKRFPKNANVAATIALAGIGFERTVVRIVADPRVDRNIHTIEAAGQFGELSIRVAGEPLPRNPRSSSLTAMSLLRCVQNRFSAIVI